MALRFKAMSFLKSTIKKVRENRADPHLDVCSLGYQYVRLSMKELPWLIGSERINSTLVRIDVYSSSMLESRRMATIPFRELKELLLDMDRMRSLKIDMFNILKKDLEAETYVFEAENLFGLMDCGYRAMDIIQFSGEDIIHNLNEPLDSALWDKFDLVVDGGTIEHCFNAPEALRSVARMVKTGGAAVHFSPMACPNHGFYNFNPCFFNEFYSSNGFVTGRILGGLSRGDSPLVELPVAGPYPAPADGSSMLFESFKVESPEQLVCPIQSIYQ